MTAINGPLSEAIGLAVLHLLWQGALVAGVLAVALRLLARSPAGVRYAISCGALAALVVFGVATAYRSYEPNAAAAPPLAVEEIAPTLLAGAAGDPGTLAIAAATLRIHSPNIAMLWMMGVLILAARLAMSWTRTRELARLDAASPRGEWQPTVERLSAALGIRRVVRLIESAAVDVPSVVGFLKPVVLVPASSLSGLSPRQLEMIVAHELAHIRRHDYVVNMLQSVAETLLFFHPAAWWISRQIRIERENCCDDLAVAICGNAIEYARALTMLEELRVGPSLALAASGGSLLDRVRRLAGRGERKMVNGWTAVAAAISFAVVMMVTSLPLRAERDAPDPPSPPAAEIDVVAAPEPPEAPRAVRSSAPARPPRATVAPAPEPPVFDFDFELPDVDIDPPEIPLPPMPDVLVTPRPAIAPLPPMAVAAAARTFDYIEAESDRPLSDSGPLTVDELISLRIHKVTPEYINEMRRVFGSMTLKQLTSLKVMGVTPAYVAELRAAGVDVKTPKEAISLRTFKVTPEFVRSLAAAGYAKLSVRDLTRLAMAGVNAEFIRDISRSRDKK